MACPRHVLPSFFSAALLQRWHPSVLLRFALVVQGMAGVLLASGLQQPYFLLGLALQGVAWNITFVTASDWIVKILTEEEKAQGQGIAEIAFFGSNTLGALCAGSLYATAGWITMSTAVGASVAVYFSWTVLRTIFSRIRAERPLRSRR